MRGSFGSRLIAVLQHLEFVLTVIPATLVLRERPGWRGNVGIALVGMGVALFSLAPGTLEGPGRSSRAGVALIVAACAAWAVDNTLAREASEIDPLVVVGIKGIGAGLVLCAMGAVLLAVDRHVHHQTHEFIRHTHRHHHLDGHHAHPYAPSAVDPAVEHVHEHEHERFEHSHPMSMTSTTGIRTDIAGGFARNPRWVRDLGRNPGIRLHYFSTTGVDSRGLGRTPGDSMDGGKRRAVS